MVDLSLFSDSVSVLKEIGSGVIQLTALPKERREHYRGVVDETFTVLDHALLLVIQRLADCLCVRKEQNDQEFIAGIYALQFVADWERAEREVRLCRALRSAGEEMRNLFSNIGDRISLRDSSQFWRLVSGALEGEMLLANQISDMLSVLSQINDVDMAEGQLRECIGNLRTVRRDLIEAQVEMLRAI